MAVMRTRRISPEEHFRAAQGPGQWLLGAERLAGAADIIMENQAEVAAAYIRAANAASELASIEAVSSDSGSAAVDIDAPEPLYLPAQLLYAFALENLLKGLLVATQPSLIGDASLNTKLKKHRLHELVVDVGLALTETETLLLKALSDIAVWAGRYPTPAKVDGYSDVLPVGSNPDSVLDWGSRHTEMRRLFQRFHEKLCEAVGPLSRHGAVVAFSPLYVDDGETAA